MIAASLLAALLATAPAATMEAANVGTSTQASNPADENVTLNLRDASLTNLLEKFAIILGVTPIIAPGVSGTVTIESTASIREHLRDLESKFHLTIRVADGRMFVSKKTAAAEPLDDEAADARYLADAQLPRRAAGAVPKAFDGTAEIRTNSGEYQAYSMAAAGAISVPGCKGGLSIIPLPGDRFDGLPSLVLMGDGVLPRVLSPTRDESVSVEVPGCPSPLSLRLSNSSAGALSATPLIPFGTFRVVLQVVEVTGQAENVLSAPRLLVVGGEAASIQSGSARRSASGVNLLSRLQAAIAVVDASEKRATVAVSASVMRDVDPRDGGPPVTIRVAHTRESARLEFGKTQRMVLAQTYGRGDSALVLDVSIERVPGKS